MLPLLSAVLLSAAGAAAPATSVPFKTLEDGLELAEVKAVHPSDVGDSVLTIVRVDPTKRRLVFEGRKLDGGELRTAPEWAKEKGLALATNAGMFETDYATTTGYTKANGVFINKHKRKSYSSFLAFDPVDPKLPAARMLDPDCDDVDALLPKYRTVVQSLRIIDCMGKPRWGDSPRKWSEALAAVDAKGRVLFVYTRSPFTMKALGEELAALPLEIRGAMHLEGGPEVSLVVKAGGVSMERVGSFETGFQGDGNNVFWKIPNVLGVRAK